MIGLVVRGLAAGLVGTAVMTLAQKIKNKQSGEGPSLTPAKAIEKITGVEPENEAEERRLANAVHFAYGTSWGLARAGMSAIGLRGLPATMALFGLVMGAAAVMLPRMGLAPRVREWTPKQLASDALMHGIYAFGTSAAFRVLAPLRA